MSLYSIIVAGRFLHGEPLERVTRSLQHCDQKWPNPGQDTPRLVDWPRLIERELEDARTLALTLAHGWETSLQAALGRVAALAFFGLEAEQRRKDCCSKRMEEWHPMDRAHAREWKESRGLPIAEARAADGLGGADSPSCPQGGTAAPAARPLQRSQPLGRPEVQPVLVRVQDADGGDFEVRRCGSCLEAFLVPANRHCTRPWFCCPEHEQADIDAEREELEQKARNPK